MHDMSEWPTTHTRALDGRCADCGLCDRRRRWPPKPKAAALEELPFLEEGPVQSRELRPGQL